MKKNSSTTVPVARVALPGGPPTIVVIMPWAYFRHTLGPDAYRAQFFQAAHRAIIVSAAPSGELIAEENDRELWAMICAHTPAANLGWHEAQIDPDPAIEIQFWMDRGMR